MTRSGAAVSHMSSRPQYSAGQIILRLEMQIKEVTVQCQLTTERTDLTVNCHSGGIILVFSN